jgi:hypothetical protein
MKNHRVTLRVELEPSGSASIDTTEIRASIDWMNAGVNAQVEEDPKNIAFGDVPGNARPTVENALISDLSYLLLAKAVSEDITVPDDIAKDVGKLFSQFQEVFTGENILFLVQFSRLFGETVTAAETYLSKGIYKPQTETAILSELVGILLNKPLPTEFVTMEDLMGFLHERDWYENVFVEPVGDAVNALRLNQAILNNRFGGDLISWSLERPIQISIPEPVDVYNRVVQFVRDYYSPVLMVDTADFNSGDGLEYSFLKSLYDAHSVEDQIIVGLLYEKAYLETVNMEIKGDVLNDGLLGQYTINQSIGGEHLQLGFIKSLVDACVASDAYDRVIQWERNFQSSNVTMVDTADFNSGDGLEYQFNKGLLDTPIITDQITAGLSLIREYSDTINVNPENVPINAHVINLLMLNDSPGGDRFSYLMQSAILSETLNGPVINTNVMNGNFTP